MGLQHVQTTYDAMNHFVKPKIETDFDLTQSIVLVHSEKKNV